MVEVHKVTICVVNHDQVSERDMRVMFEQMRYLFNNVVSVETKEVDWDDDHPLNYDKTLADEFRKMFREAYTVPKLIRKELAE